MSTMRVMFAAITAGIAITAGMLVGGSGLAHAAPDEDGFIAELQADGVPMQAGPQYALGVGYQVCGMLRNDASTDVVASHFTTLDTPWVAAEIAASQHNLCPDTLPKQGT